MAATSSTTATIPASMIKPNRDVLEKPWCLQAAISASVGHARDDHTKDEYCVGVFRQVNPSKQEVSPALSFYSGAVQSASMLRSSSWSPCEQADDHISQHLQLQKKVYYALFMAYIVTLGSGELGSIRTKLRVEQRLTKALPKGTKQDGSVIGSRMVLVLSQDNSERAGGHPLRHLAWLGVVARHNTVGAVDKSITVDPLRECMEAIKFNGADGLLSRLPSTLREQFEQAAVLGTVGECSDAVWKAVDAALRQDYPELVGLLDWLTAQADPPVLDSRDPADRAWQEQQDATRTLLRIAEFPHYALAAWQRPLSRDAPYLAGLIAQPVEHSLIDHDVRAAGDAFGLLSEWQHGNELRCDIHVLQDADGRRLEVTNVNATPVETRLGTDMIYFHEPTLSFVLVQYKRLNPLTKSIYVDKRLMSQIDRLEKVARLSRPPTLPSEWRMGSDPCFLKLAHWPEDIQKQPVEGLVPGMYLPISYVRLLLQDDCTRGAQASSEARLLGYKQVERYLVNTQFIELIKHGLAGTVGTTPEHLRSLVRDRIQAGHSVVVATESSPESVSARQKRAHKRGSKAKRYAHKTYSQDTLF